MSTTIKPLATEEGQLALATALNHVTEGVLHITENVTAAANSATSASNSATSASGSATTATNKANEASASATAASKAEIDAENFAVSDVTFTKETGSDHTTTYYSAKHYAESASTEATTATDAATYISAHADQIDQNTGGVSANSKRIGNIEKLLQGNLYDYQTDNTSAYTKSVPSGAMPYAGLEKVGGKTVVWNQLVDSGTTSVATISGHKYYTLIDGTASIVTADGTAISVVDDTADMVCDLTLMFGSGNEPSTTADFTAIFGATHYSYNAGELLSAGVTEVVSKDTNNDTLQTYSVPAEVQALEGYGLGTPEESNYVDFENKVFHKMVGLFDMGDFNWNAGTRAGHPWFWCNFGSIGGAASGGYKIVAEGYATTSHNNIMDKSIELYSYNVNAFQINIFDDSMEGKTGAEFKSAVAGKKFVVHLGSPSETDISEYLTDDNLINVEANGTLTFPNSNGTDYQIPVPSEETYMIDLQSAIGG